MTTATVVGSGPNGLAAAIRLAQAGLRVTVLEAADVAGGGARTSELTVPGVRHDDCSTALPGAIASPFFRSLGLERHGLEWVHHEAVLAHPTEHGTALLWQDLERTATGLGHDGARWRRIFGPLVRRPEALFETAFAPIVGVPRHPLDFTRLGLRSALPATWTAARFRSDAAGALFTGIAAHAFGDLRGPVTSAVGVMLAACAHAYGWPMPRGGAAQLTAALLAEFAELDGTVETGRRVTDVREIDTDVTVLTVPPRSALEMLAPPPRVARAWRRFRPGPAAFKVDLAIEGDVPWSDPACNTAGVVHLGGGRRSVAQAEAAIVRGRLPAHPFILVAQPHLADPSRSHNGINPLWVYAHVPNGWPIDETERVLAILEGYAPGLRERIVGVHTRGPAALERHNAAYLGGDIGGGATTMRQLLARPRPGTAAYRSGVRGVYLGGSSTPPAGGVHGMSGFHAAETALRDLRR